MSIHCLKISLMRRSIHIVFALVSATLLLACGTAPSIKSEIAPTGALRMGLYKGSPASYLVDGTIENNRGVGFNLGKGLAKSLNIPYQPMIFESNAEVLQAIKDQKVDLVFTNATPVRAQFIQFSDSFVEIEKSFLLKPGSKLQSIDEIDRTGIKIGFSIGSSSERELPILIKNATLVKFGSTSEAIAALQSGSVDAFSSNKGILFEMGDKVPGSRVLPGSIAMESIALGVPVSRSDLRPVLNQYYERIRASGELDAMITRAGMRGTVKR